MRLNKVFKLSPDDIRPMACGFGLCFASDRITVDGMPVGYMYREYSDHPTDSGWRFLAGDEDRDYVNNADNFALYDVNIIANYDQAILDYLEVPEPTALERDRDDKFTEVPFDPPVEDDLDED